MNETTTLAQFSAFYTTALLLGVLIGYRISRFSRFSRFGVGRFNLVKRNTFIERI